MVKERIYDFGNFCVRCGSTEPDCYKAADSMYKLLTENYKEDPMIKTGADAVLTNCGDKKCGTAISNYINLKRYIDSFE